MSPPAAPSVSLGSYVIATLVRARRYRSCTANISRHNQWSEGPMATATRMSARSKRSPSAGRDLPPELKRRLEPATFPRSPSPMLCTLVDRPPASKDWVFEPKYDGLRVLGIFDGKTLILLSRNDKSQ